MLENKKICFVSSKAYPYFNEKAGHSGGAEHQLFYFGTNLAKRNNFEITYAVADYGQAKTEFYENVKVYNAFSFKDNKLKSFFQLIRTLRKINADLYIFRAVSPNLSPVFIILKYFLRKKIIYMIASELEVSKRKLKQAKSFFTWKSMELSYQLANLIIAQNNEQKDEFLRNRAKKRIDIVRSYFEIDEHEKPVKANDILWVGRCIELKQPEIFLSLAEKFPNEQFQMICPKHSDAEYWKSIKKRADKISNLVFHGYVEPTEIKEYFRSAKIYVITSKSEGMPNTILEAAQYSCAILSLNINPDNLINKFNLGFFTEEKKELEVLFREMLSNNEKLIEFQNNGIKFLKTWHKPEKVMSDFKEIVKKLA